MKKEGSLTREKTHLKKKGLYRVMLGHPGLGLTHRVESDFITMLKHQKMSLRALIITYSVLL